MKRISLVFILVILTLCGCQKPAISVEDGTTTTETGDPESGDIDESDPSGTGNDDIVDVDGSVEAELDESEFTTVIDIVWSGATATVTNGSSLKISQEGAHIVIGEPTAAGKKVRINLSGTSDDGSLKIYNGVKADYSNKKMLLNFNEVSLTSSTGPAINIQSGKTVYVLLDGSNSLCDAATYSGIPEGEDAKGCFFSEKQLVFSGTGSLTVKGQNKHAVCVDDYVTFQGGKLIVSGAASDGIHANNYVRVEAGTLDITSDGEG
ncbi:MAG: carbohydrate-binding domain-containing protein, partial [Candidatus Cryptobacteroides sp.]